MAKQFSVYVNIGGKLNPSFASAFGQAESRINRFSRLLQKTTAGMRAALREVGTATREASKLAAAGAGFHGSLRTAGHAYRAGAELQGARVDMRKAGIGESEIGAIWDQSLALAAKHRNVTQSGLMELAKEVRSIMTDPHEVMEVMPSLAAAKSLLDARDSTGRASEGLGLLVKGAEVIGAAKSPERFVHLVDGYVKAMQVMGRTITPESIYEFDKYSKIAGARLSDRFLLTTAQSLGQELGGSTAGLGVGGLYKQVSGGMQNLHTAAQEFARVGLIDEANLDRTKTGEIKGVKKGVQHAVKGDTLAATDPDLWVYRVVLPALERAGIKSEADQLAWGRKAFPNSNVADLFGKLVVQRRSFEAHARQYQSATGLAGASLNRDDPTAALGGLTKSVETFFGVLTSPVMMDAGHGLDSLSGWISSFSTRLDAFNKAHPTLAKFEAPLAGGLAVAGAAGAAGAIWKTFADGFGLKGSAVALDGAAAALTTAAGRLGALKPWDVPRVMETPAAAAAGASFGAGGAAIAAGAAAGAYFDWNLGGNPGAVGALIGQESDLSKSMRSLREESEAFRRAGAPAAWATSRPKTLPGSGEASRGYTSSYQVDGSLLRDFLWGKETQSAMLPGFGSRVPLHMPESVFDGVKDQATRAGKAAGESTAERIGAAIESKATEIAGKAREVFQRVQSVFSSGIDIPVNVGTATKTTPAAPAVAGARALGGPVTGGLPYIVGERGPEIFVPATSGRIETNGVLKSLSRAGGTAGSDGLKVGVDATAVAKAGVVAQRSGAEIRASLDRTFKPLVDTASIEAATAKAEKLKAVLAAIGAGSIAVGAGGGEGGGAPTATGGLARAGRAAGGALGGPVTGGRAAASGGALAAGFGGGVSGRASGGSDPAAALVGGYTGNDGRRAARSGMTAAGRENVASWLDFLQRPQDQGGMGADADKARGLVAMMQGESGLNLDPASRGDHNRAGVPQSFGTVQWNVGAGRFQQLKALADSLGKPWTDRSVQQAFFRYEMLEGRYKGAWQRIQAARDAEGVLAAGIVHYENPKRHALAYRIRKPFLDRLRRDAETAKPAVEEAAKPLIAVKVAPAASEAGKAPPKLLKPASMPDAPGQVMDRGVLAGARARGGPVTRGLSYLVGERGPEIFVPGASGQITASDTLNRLAELGRAVVEGSGDGARIAPDPRMVAKLRPGGDTIHTRGDTSVHNEWHINGASDPVAVQRQVEVKFLDLIRQLESDQRGSLSD